MHMKKGYIMLMVLIIVVVSSVGCGQKKKIDNQKVRWEYARCTFEIPETWEYFERKDEEMVITVDDENVLDDVDCFRLEVLKTEEENCFDVTSDRTADRLTDIYIDYFAGYFEEEQNIDSKEVLDMTMHWSDGKTKKKFTVPVLKVKYSGEDLEEVKRTGYFYFFMVEKNLYNLTILQPDNAEIKYFDKVNKILKSMTFDKDLINGNYKDEEESFIEDKTSGENFVQDLEYHSEWISDESETTVEFCNSTNRKSVIIQAMQEIGISDFDFDDVDWVWDGEDFLSAFSYVKVKKRELKIIASFDGTEWTVESISEGEDDKHKTYYSTDSEDKIVKFKSDNDNPKSKQKKDEEEDNDLNGYYISGCNAYDIMINLKNRFGIDKPSPEENADTAECDGYTFLQGDTARQYYISTYENLKNVYMAEFTYSNINGESESSFMKQAKEYLTYVATTPYDTAKPQKAQKWVENNIEKSKKGKTIEKIFGDAQYSLYGDYNSENITLEITITPFPY